MAIIFGAVLPLLGLKQHTGEFFAGWITEYSLSFDNLFLFFLIFSKLKVKPELEELTLFIGILLSILLRAIFIFTGSALVNNFGWIFFVFAAMLIYTAVSLLKENKEDEWKEGLAIRYLRSKGFSTMILALTALSIVNLVFAFDSIPAIFGITKSTFIIITANIFAVMGLRQLYLIIGGYLRKIYYLNEGLAFLLGFIGIKLAMTACHNVGWKKIGNFSIPEIGTNFTLIVIILTLGFTFLLSKYKGSKNSP